MFKVLKYFIYYYYKFLNTKYKKKVFNLIKKLLFLKNKNDK